MKRKISKITWLVLPFVVITTSLLLVSANLSQKPNIEFVNSSNATLVSKSVPAQAGLETDISVKATYPNERADRFVDALLAAKDPLALLENFVDATSLPITEPFKTKVITEGLVSNYDIGFVSFSLSIDKYLNDEGTLVEKPKVFKLVFEALDPVFEQTKILPNNSYPKGITPAQFKQFVVDTNNDVIAENLFKFVHFTSIPDNAAYTIDWVSDDADAGTITFKVNTDVYYDKNKDLTNNGSFNVSLSLLPNDKIPSATRLLGYSSASLPVDITIDIMKKQLTDVATGKLDYAFLSQFVNLSTLPYDAELELAGKISANPDSGNVSFNLIYDHYYDGENEFSQAENRTTSFSWILAKPVISSTVIRSNVKISRYLSVKEFIDEVAPGNVTNVEALSQFVDLSNIPSTANISVDTTSVTKNPTTAVIRFTLFVDQYYSNSVIINGSKSFVISLSSDSAIIQKTETFDNWIYYAIAGSIALVLLIWVAIVIKWRERHNNRYFEFEDYEKIVDRPDFEEKNKK